jgi:hypothetical protein
MTKTDTGCDECGKPIEPDDLHGRDPRYCKGHQYLATPYGQRFAATMREVMGRGPGRSSGSARQCQWLAEDGWLIIYTTSRVEGGPDHGKFLAMAYKPVGKGSRGGKATAEQWHLVYRRPFTKRKDAKARATALYYQHSPKAKARHRVA